MTHPILTVQDELNAFLLRLNLKPAAIITLNPLADPNICKVYEGDKMMMVDPEIPLSFGSLWAPAEFIHGMKAFFDSEGFDYFPADSGFSHAFYGKPFYNLFSEQPIKVHMSSWFVSKDKERVKQYRKAKTSQEKNLALGLPLDELTDPNINYRAILQRSAQSGLEIPLWLAYLSYAPKQILVVKHDKFPSRSKDDGTLYQETAQRRHPLLAERVETDFRQTYLSL